MSIQRTVAIMAGLLTLAACAEPIETRPASTELAPLPYQPPIPGETIVWQDGDEQTIWTVSAMANGIATRQSSSGCSWTESSLFAPSSTWKNCGNWADGTQQYATEGEIFPLEVGKSMTFDLSGSDEDGAAWSYARTCTVDGTAQVDVPAGTFDTFQVTCDDGRTRRTYFMAPDTGTPVLYERFRRSTNETVRLKMISYTPGGQT